MSTIDLIKKHEGYREFIYEDTKGRRTIGIGFNLEAGMSQEEAELLASFRINKIAEVLRYKIKNFNSLSATRQDVLIDVAYNVGINGLLGFEKMLTAIDELDYKRAKLELLDSNAARELHNRYGELAEMMEAG